MQCEMALRFYLIEVHELGAELSISRMLRRRHARAGGSRRRARATTIAHRDDEPYRRALIGVYARLAGTLEKLTGGAGAAPRGGAGRALRQHAGPFSPISSRSTSRCASHHSEVIAAQRLEPLIRAVEVFGFHLATRRSAPELRPARGGDRRTAARPRASPTITRALAELAKQQLLLRLLADPRPAARCRTRTIRDRAVERAGDLRDARAMRARFWRRGDPPLHHQPHRDRQRPAGSAAAAKGMRPDARHARSRDAERVTARPDHRAAVRDHRRPAQRRADHARLLRAAGHRRAGRQLRAASRTSCWAIPTATRTAASSPATGSSTAPRRRWRNCSPAMPNITHAAVPRPRRHGRARRRPELPGHPRAAAGHGERPDPPHRTGRGDRRQIRQSARSAAQSRNARRRDAGSDAAAPHGKAPPHGVSRRRAKRSSRRAWRPIASSSTRRRASSIISSRRRRSPKSPS